MFFLPLLGTGEHGVGIGKKEYLVEELGEGTVQLMKTIKKAIDPLGIFNPGKVCAILKIRLFCFVHISYLVALSGRCANADGE
jgi:FAD linked oxidases, C-terminal domain